ncbi:hypothetical protein FHS95_000101 [Sphingomonas naasensis]|uniref:Lipoprotein n=1 Tax=Sphingomonas naasensis TaxID=1344951 RepID=A0A4S1WVU3_9SPHN|nr:hypothetical protein [Sphingomonas naasensis]NIJ18432.1 hypothetical protein [Sphingomonas naasensis]TGX45696.1 hypothetical protein E5A74_00500 [Sphingomonas naasensis]
MRAAALLLLLALGGCSGGQSGGNGQAPQDLESAAIARGLVRDPDDSDLTGLYARDTDRICIVRTGSTYRIGAYVDYGDRITCSGSGTVERDGGRLRIALGKDGGCRFDAQYDGDHIKFPGVLPDACKPLCARRASFTGLEVTRLSESGAEAAAMRDAAGRRLCGE